MTTDDRDDDGRKYEGLADFLYEHDRWIVLCACTHCLFFWQALALITLPDDKAFECPACKQKKGVVLNRFQGRRRAVKPRTAIPHEHELKRAVNAILIAGENL
jgi:hypothetical protein